MLPKQVTEVTVSALVFIVLMHSKNKKDCLKTVLFYSHLQNVPHMWYLLIPRCSFLYHICGTFLSTTKCITYVVSFWYHKRARNPLLMFRSQKTWYHRMEGNGRRLSRASRCMWINPLDVHSPKFTHNFFGDDVFSGVSFNLSRSRLTIWGLLRATAEVALFFAF